MNMMIELGRFGDERLKKGGPIFWPRSWRKAQFACAGWETVEPRPSAMDGFCTIDG